MKIVICGSSSGIGASLLKHLRHSGHKCWGVARRKSVGIHSQVDLTDYPHTSNTAEIIGEEWGSSIGAIIVCAGFQPTHGKTLQANYGAWEAGITRNLITTFNALRAFTPLMDKCESGRPKIIVFSGGGASKARPYFSSYACAKTAIVRLVEIVAEEEPTLDINAVAPGRILTRMTRDVMKAGAKLVGQQEIDEARAAAETGGDSMDRVCDLVDFLLSPNPTGLAVG
jgi:NAD(P)-dependent dehydrogenase (short-subunit alcohol dehydrogenase family)